MRRYLILLLAWFAPVTAFGQGATGRSYPAVSPNQPSTNIGIVPNPSACPSNTYTFLFSDQGKYVTFNDASACAVTLPQANSAGFISNYFTLACDIGAGTATITPTTSTISWTDGTSYHAAQTSMALTTGQCAFIYSDNTNYFALIPGGSSGGGGVNTCGTNSTFIATFASTTTVACSVDKIDANGNIIIPPPSSINVGTSTSGNLATFTSSATVGNCAVFPCAPLGVFTNNTGGYQSTGFGTVNLDATQNVTYGDNLCSSSAGATAHDNGSTPCATGLWVGVVTTTASSVSSASVYLEIR